MGCGYTLIAAKPPATGGDGCELAMPLAGLDLSPRGDDKRWCRVDLAAAACQPLLMRFPQFGQGLISGTSIPISWKRHALRCAEPHASMRHFLRTEFSDNVQQIVPINLRAMQRSPTAARKVRSPLLR